MIYNIFLSALGEVLNDSKSSRKKKELKEAKKLLNEVRLQCTSTAWNRLYKKLIKVNYKLNGSAIQWEALI